MGGALARCADLSLGRGAGGADRGGPAGGTDGAQAPGRRMKTIRARLVTIAVLLGIGLWAVCPKTETRGVRDVQTGLMKDTVERQVPVNLGLDLSGGVHLGLGVDQSKAPVADCAEAIRGAERVGRRRINESGTTEPVVQVVGSCRLIVELPGESDPARARDIIQRSAFLEFRVVDMKNEFRDAIPAIDQALHQAGVKGPGQGAASAVAKLFGDTSKSKGADTVGGSVLGSLLQAGTMPGEFFLPEEQRPYVDSLIKRPEVQRLIPRHLELRWGATTDVRNARAYRALYAVESRPMITGEYLTKAVAQRDPLTNQSVVNFTLTHHARRIFYDETGKHVGDYMAIMLDGQVQGQPPVIRSQIGAQGQIELGAKPLVEANDLALVLRAGALPAPLTIVEERSIGPILGHDSIHACILPGASCVRLVVSLMVIYYRVSGLIAVGALPLYGTLTLGGLALFGVTVKL